MPTTVLDLLLPDSVITGCFLALPFLVEDSAVAVGPAATLRDERETGRGDIRNSSSFQDELSAERWEIVGEKGEVGRMDDRNERSNEFNKRFSRRETVRER